MQLLLLTLLALLGCFVAATGLAYWWLFIDELGREAERRHRRK